MQWRVLELAVDVHDQASVSRITCRRADQGNRL